MYEFIESRNGRTGALGLRFKFQTQRTTRSCPRIFLQTKSRNFLEVSFKRFLIVMIKYTKINGVSVGDRHVGDI